MENTKKMPKIAMGAWAWGNDGTFGDHYEAADLKDVYEAAMNNGLNLWDTAFVYGMGTSESGLGDETENDSTQEEVKEVIASGEFVYITGGTYEMGSPETENWRTLDETLHTVTVSDFYMSTYEVTQEEYEAVMGNNPSSFSGNNLPVENISWLDAIYYCNTRSEQEGLTPVYIIDGDIDSGNVSASWNRGADGYRLPTEAEWEYACRAGTTTPFNTETSISAEEANYYGHYPYEIEENYTSTWLFNRQLYPVVLCLSNDW